MKLIRNLLLASVALVFFTASSFAQGDVISAADFMKLVKTNKNLVIVDASKKESFTKTHIKNAVNIPHKSLYNETEIEGLIMDAADLAAFFGNHGISNTSTVVVYDGGSQKYSSRVYWVLKYMGASDVKILHKDMNEWRKSRVPITKMPTKAKKATFTPNVNSSIIADMAYVKSGKAIIIDARDANEFAGTTDKSDGHIPASVNINYKDFLNDKEAFKTKAEIVALLKAKGINESTPMVTYCQTAVRASVIYVAVVNILGWNTIKIYDGAYNEWVAKGNKLDAKAGVSVKKKQNTSSGGC
jgi:thiosulfate/3-mercaptopyruvate sulfurtransferase